MSGYIVEEFDECPVFVNISTKEENIEYWRLYSPIQKKRFIKVLNQLKDIWFDVYNQLKILRDHGALDIDTSNSLMNKVHRLFIIQLRSKIEYYNEEKLKQRKQKNYISKKINKLKMSKQSI